MIRRDFIKVSSALTLASSVPLIGFVSDKKQSFRKNKIGVSSYSFWHFDSNTKPTMNYCIDKASAMGFDGIEFLLVQMSSVDNSHLQNLKKQAFDAGLDIMGLSTHQGFVNPSKEYRDKNIKKTIDQIEIAYKLGIPTMRINTGRWGTSESFDALMENKGIELDGTYLLMNDANKGLDLYFNWAQNKNKVTDLAGTEVIYLGTGSVNSVAIVGHAVGTLHGTGSKTYALANDIDPVGYDDGINVFTDDNSLVGNLALDNNGFPQITSLKVVLGDPNPDWRGSLGLNARWKNFNMNVLFEHSQGGDYSPRTQWVLRRFGTTAETGNFIESLPKDLINVDGDTIAAGSSVRGTIHDFGGGDVLLDEAWYRHGIGGGFGDNQAYNFAVKDATFSRIRELSLSYTFTSPAFRETTKLSSVTLRATGRNLWAWYKELVGLDPATNQAGVANGFGLDYFTNPSTKSYLFTVSVNF